MSKIYRFVSIRVILWSHLGLWSFEFVFTTVGPSFLHNELFLKLQSPRLLHFLNRTHLWKLHFLWWYQHFFGNFLKWFCLSPASFIFNLIVADFIDIAFEFLMTFFLIFVVEKNGRVCLQLLYFIRRSFLKIKHFKWVDDFDSFIKSQLLTFGRNKGTNLKLLLRWIEVGALF